MSFVENPQTATLADNLRKASDAYYNGAPIMSDAQYDALEDGLRKLSPEHPVFAEIGAPVSSGWQKVGHPIQMGSLNKAQTEEEFLEWAQKVKGHTLFMTEKLDGISILLVYEGGKLVRAQTRGDGVIGEDITRNVRIMKGIPSDILYEETLYIRGEIVCRKTDFEEHFQGESNPRNTASGTAKRQSGWQKAKHLTVYAYNLSAKNPDHGNVARSDEFATLKTWGFLVPSHYKLTNATEVISYRDDYIRLRRERVDYDIDGLVVEVDNKQSREVMGERDMRPKGAIAFKFPHESKPSVIRDIVWQVGASGRVTPVANFDSVLLAGANVKQASLHNCSNIERLSGVFRNPAFFRKGDRIMVSRRNDVIPYVESMLEMDESGKSLLVPTSCPACFGNLAMEGEYLICTNTEGCSAQALGSLQRWVSKVGVLHFGEALMKAVVDAGMVSTIGDLYRLDADKVAALDMDGRKVGGGAKRALASLNSKKELTLALFVGSLGIPLVGRKMVKLLVDAGYDDFTKLADATEAELARVEGFGEGRAKSFREGFDTRRPLILDILAAGVTVKAPVAPTGSAMAGQAICMTGFRDKDMGAAIEDAGGKVASGVSKNTTLLVAKDPSSTSGKAKKARGLGIEIIGPDEMWNRLGGRP